MKSVKQVIFAFISIILFNSCEQTNEWTLGIIPEDAKFNSVEVTNEPVTAVTVKEDSINTMVSSVVIWGSYVDPVFGKTKAEFAAQFRTPGTALILSDTTQALRLELVLRNRIDTTKANNYANNYYGTTGTVQKMKIFELKKSLSFEKDYTSKITIPAEELDFLQSYDYVITPTDTVFKITLPDELFYKIKAAVTNVKDTTYQNLKFLEIFKGLYFGTEQVDANGGFAFFNLSHANSQLNIIYRHNHDTADRKYTLTANTASVKASFYTHEHSAEIESNLNSEMATQLYIQPMSGLYAKIKLPNITANWRDKVKNQKTIIERATLVLPRNTAESDISLLKPTPSLLALRDTNFVKDYYSSTFAPILHNSSANNYTIEIAAELMDYLKSDSTEPFEITVKAAYPTYYPQRAIIKSFNNEGGATLKIRYSKINL